MRDYFSPDWVEFTFGLLTSATWQAAILVAIAMLASLCVRRASVRCTIWTCCVVGLAVVPVVSFALPHCYLAYHAEAEPLHFPTQVVPHFTGGRWGAGGNSFFEGTWGDGVIRTLLVVWLAGVAVSLVRLAWSWISMARLLQIARPCRDPRVKEIMRKVVERPDGVTVLEMDGLVGAICWQIHRPKIILPTDTHRLSDLELEMMLRHEWAHLRRSDPGLLFLQRLVEVFYWYHPLVWCLTLQTSRYREFVCDDAVLAAGYKPTDYAQCLGQLAVWYYAPLPMAPAGLGMLWSQHLVLERVKRLVRGDHSVKEMPGIQRAAFFLTASVVLLCCSLVRVDWRHVRFHAGVRWTAWPEWTAKTLDIVGLRLRDYPLDAHRYDPNNAVAPPYLKRQSADAGVN